MDVSGAEHHRVADIVGEPRVGAADQQLGWLGPGLGVSGGDPAEGDEGGGAEGEQRAQPGVGGGHDGISLGLVGATGQAAGVTASAMIWLTLSGWKKSGTVTEPAMRPRNRAIWAGLPATAPMSACISGGGGASSASPHVNS